jgi:hypothetical protein
MQKVTTEQAIKNQIASAEMEGFRFSKDEVEVVRKCIDGEISYQQFLEKVLANHKGS